MWRRRAEGVNDPPAKEIYLRRYVYTHHSTGKLIDPGPWVTWGAVKNWREGDLVYTQTPAPECAIVQDVSSLKHNAQLRHVLAHLHQAIEHLAHGSTDAALHELESIEPMIFWESDEEMRAFLEGAEDGKSEAEEAAGVVQHVTTPEEPDEAR